jgi:hypothetical protein
MTDSTICSTELCNAGDNGRTGISAMRGFNGEMPIAVTSAR